MPTKSVRSESTTISRTLGRLAWAASEPVSPRATPGAVTADAWRKRRLVVPGGMGPHHRAAGGGAQPSAARERAMVRGAECVEGAVQDGLGTLGVETCVVSRGLFWRRLVRKVGLFGHDGRVPGHRDRLLRDRRLLDRRLLDDDRRLFDDRPLLDHRRVLRKQPPLLHPWLLAR